MICQNTVRQIIQNHNHHYFKTMKQQKLNVSEVFYSIQGEGQTMGVPAVFLRLGGCNILCESSSWVCDTIEVWRKSKATAFEDVLNPFEGFFVSKDVHLVITGGEPLIHQAKIVDFVNHLRDKLNYLPPIEIETNGTIVPSKEMLDIVSYWNVSPKLSNAGPQNTKEVRINPEALEIFRNQNKKTIFKFVIENEKDLNEVLDDFGNHISMSQTVLMPAGSSQEELERTRPVVAELCRCYSFRYSDRLHVVIWNKKTGV